MLLDNSPKHLLSKLHITLKDGYYPMYGDRTYRLMPQNNQTQPLLRKLQKIFKDGYRPARGDESYRVKLNNGRQVYDMVNCLGHILNLRNQQFQDYDIHASLYGYFPNLAQYTLSYAAGSLFDFVKETGLKIEECDPHKSVTDFKSWKVALYFDDNITYRDFHFLLEDAPQKWSSKIGFTPFVEHIHENIPPQMYQQNSVSNISTNYELYGTYKITNPNADENNPYVKGHYTQERTL